MSVKLLWVGLLAQEYQVVEGFLFIPISMRGTESRTVICSNPPNKRRRFQIVKGRIVVAGDGKPLSQVSRTETPSSRGATC